MKFLIVAASVLACAVAAPSGWYGNGLLGHGAHLGLGHGAALAHSASWAGSLGHGAGLAHAVPTISSGDIQGAAIDAHVNAADHARAGLDASREHHDQAAEIQGQAVNAAEDHAWQSVSAAQTAHAQHDGAAAAVAPIVAHQLAGHGAHGVAAHGFAGYGFGHGLAAPLAAHGYGHGLAGATSVATQSLSQTHPAPVAHRHLAYGHGLAHGLSHGFGHGHGWAY